ncbi:hypothetical protein BDV98DRAFT_596947 [Pterulicium gracile]|uniref:F-box domain-containing protein n=1 Tax=Pterulicium gracile TaxID=1884261 RepID=A0A5C3Q5S0_9AGAR|nr:hypothetical protein BDV98DRAFT_596947 [Pterula gracilis]
MVGHPLRRPGSYWSLFSQETRITIFEQCSLASFEAPPEYTAPSEQDLGYKNIPLTEVSRENLAAEPTHSMHPRAAPVLLTHVCRSWRLLALATSQLWTRFKIIMTASPTWENPSVKLTFPFAAMEAQVERCGEFYSGRGGDLEVVLELPSYIRQRTEDALSVAFKFSLLLNLVMAPDPTATYQRREGYAHYRARKRPDEVFDPVPRCATELLLANILDRSHFHGESPTDEKKLYTSAHIQANNLTWIDIPVSLTEDLEWGVGKDYEWIVVQELSIHCDVNDFISHILPSLAPSSTLTSLTIGLQQTPDAVPSEGDRRLVSWENSPMALLRKCVESEEQEPYNLSHLQSLTCWENEADIDEHDCDALWSFINLMGSIRTPRLQVSRGLYRVVQAEDVADEAEFHLQDGDQVVQEEIWE